MHFPLQAYFPTLDTTSCWLAPPLGYPRSISRAYSPCNQHSTSTSPNSPVVWLHQPSGYSDLKHLSHLWNHVPSIANLHSPPTNPASSILDHIPNLAMYLAALSNHRLSRDCFIVVLTFQKLEGQFSYLFTSISTKAVLTVLSETADNPAHLPHIPRLP